MKFNDFNAYMKGVLFLKIPENITIAVIADGRIVYHTYYSQQEAENFIQNDMVCLPDKNRISISNDIYALEGKYLEECSRAILVFSNGDEEKKYYCEDLSKDNLVWERGM